LSEKEEPASSTIRHVMNHTAPRVHIRRLRWQNSKGETVNSREISFDADIPEEMTAREFAESLDREATKLYAA
jgi:hypothetical protein